MLIRWMVILLAALIMFFVIGWFTGNKGYGGTSKNVDERSQLIKQKSIVGSWTFLLAVFLINIILDFLI